ncbi:antibiotic biosynthesis monooxygenase family protein [Nocardia sp. NPDC051832]|uniref:putative quinol monooxygenase n=1 Tax=Nocardia sp. NPDC051832 TaxID=3155673 RepID=UPI0034242205
MLIVAGHLRVTDREKYLDQCKAVVEQARATPGCLDFSLGADLLDPDRVNILERWSTRAALDAFRGAGTAGDLDAQILSADVAEFTCDSEAAL